MRLLISQYYRVTLIWLRCRISTALARALFRPSPSGVSNDHHSHIRSLARITNGPPTASLRKTVISCALSLEGDVIVCQWTMHQNRRVWICRIAQGQGCVAAGDRDSIASSATDGYLLRKFFIFLVEWKISWRQRLTKLYSFRLFEK